MCYNVVEVAMTYANVFHTEIFQIHSRLEKCQTLLYPV